LSVWKTIIIDFVLSAKNKKINYNDHWSIICCKINRCLNYTFYKIMLLIHSLQKQMPKACHTPNTLSVVHNISLAITYLFHCSVIFPFLTKSFHNNSHGTLINNQFIIKYIFKRNQYINKLQYCIIIFHLNKLLSNLQVAMAADPET